MPAPKISHNGAPTTNKGIAVSWADPAYTRSDMTAAAVTLRPDFTIATPVTIPQIASATSPGEMVRAPSINARRLNARKSIRSDKAAVT